MDVPTEDPIERLLEEIPAKRQPAWCRQILQEAEGHAAPKGTFRESRKPQRYSGLAAQVDPVICEPSSFEEATKLQVWKDAMLEEYNSILTNDVWDVVPRPQGKLVVTSKWIYKVKFSVDGSVEKCKPDLWLGVSHRKKVSTMTRPSPLLRDIALFESLSL